MFIENQIHSEKQLKADYKIINSFDFIKKDKAFTFFIMKHNGCFLFKKSLQMFSFLNSHNDLLNIKSVNHDIKRLYAAFDLAKEEFFAQDIFGNLFYYDENGIGIFDIESGEKSAIAKNFYMFDSLLQEDFEYLTGVTYLNEWMRTTNLLLKDEERLCPKKPFIIGGEYEIENLYPKSSLMNWAFNADLAFQIKNTPDGTNINLKIL